MVIHDSPHHRFIIDDPQGLCYLEYEDRDGTLWVIHTVVPKALGGRGLAGELADAFYRWVSENRYPFASDCSYMTAWLKRHRIEIPSGN